MKGITGIIVAVGLGIAGALANLFYLHSEAQKVDTISFIGIKKGLVIGRGDRLAKDNLVEVKIPRNYAANLADYAFRWGELVGFRGDERVWRPLDSGESGILLLRSDFKEPMKELDLGKGESVRWIPIESRTFVASLITPGDQVSFILPKVRSVPTRAPAPKPTSDTKSVDPPGGAETPKPEAENVPDYAGFETEEIGPFTVVTVGNRLGDLKVMQAAKIPQLQENLLGIRVGPKNSREWIDVNNLWNRLQEVNFHQVGIALHSNK